MYARCHTRGGGADVLAFVGERGLHEVRRDGGEAVERPQRMLAGDGAFVLQQLLQRGHGGGIGGLDDESLRGVAHPAVGMREQFCVFADLHGLRALPSGTMRQMRPMLKGCSSFRAWMFAMR
jgi:hypothetical protein